MESDEALLTRARDGDDEALSAVIERYAPRVLRFGKKLCGDDEDAQEILQQTLMTAARKLRAFRGESQLSTWLFTIARGFCIKHRTRGAAKIRVEPLDEANQLAGPQEQRPDEALDRRQLGAALEQGIRSLEPSQREVLVLRDVEGLSAPEVASVLGISAEAVKSRLHRARKNLREKLEPLFSAPQPLQGCPDVLDTLSRYQEGEITRDACRTMEEHVSGCAACSARCDSLRQVLTACSASPEPELSPQLKAAVLDQMRRALRESDRPESR